MPSTSEIIASSSSFFEATTAFGDNIPVSSASHWQDSDWKLDVPVAGRRITTIRFGRVPPEFLEVAKTLVWSALVDPRSAWRRGISTVAHFTLSLDRVLAWIARTGLPLSELNDEIFGYFIDELEEEIDAGRLNSSRSERPTLSTVRQLIEPWALLSDQAEAMRQAGVDALSFDPFSERAFNSIIAELSGDERRKGNPLPDEIAGPIVDAAIAMCGTPTDEIEQAFRRYMVVRRAHVRNRGKQLVGTLPAFEFSPLEDGGAPWLTLEETSDWRTYERMLLDGLRRVVGAHLTTVFACGITRPSELLAVKGGLDPESGLPTCVKRERSASHLFDHFWMTSTRFKLTDGEPEEDEWLIGCRTAGDAVLPDAVQAIMALQKVLAPFRERAEPDVASQLLVSPGPGLLHHTGERFLPMSYGTMRTWMQLFLRDAIDWEALPDIARNGTDLRPYKTRRGENVNARAWRRTLVQFLLRIDGRMALPLARRLRHKVHYVINGAYQSADPALLEEVDDAMARTLARTLIGIADGSRPVSGWLGTLMTRHIDEVRALTLGLKGEQAIASVQTWARERQLGLFEAGPGKCGLRLLPRHALCHLVEGTSGWWQRQPSANRSDENCASCKLCVVDSDHLHFWTSRYVAARRQVLTSRLIGREDEAWVHAGQAATARNMLERLEGRIPPDEEIGQ